MAPCAREVHGHGRIEAMHMRVRKVVYPAKYPAFLWRYPDRPNENHLACVSWLKHLLAQMSQSDPAAEQHARSGSTL